MITNEQLMAELEKLRAENEALKLKNARKAGKPVAKVSAKGAVSVYGLGRFPVTLYGEQWKRLQAFMPELEAFIAANQDKLSKKEDKVVAA